MKVTVHVEGKTAKELADGLRAHIALYDAATGTASSGGKRGKAQTAVSSDDEDATFNTEEAEDVETEEDESEEAEGTEEESDEPEVTLKDVQAQARKYAAKFGEEKTIAKLKKLGAPNLKKAKPEQYAGLIAGLKV